MRRGLHNLIFVFMGLGVVCGLVLAAIGEADAPWYFPDGLGSKADAWYGATLRWLDFFGQTIFIGSLKMIVAPLILVSIVAGVTSIPSFKDAGRIGGKTLLYYLCTTTIAVAIGLVFVLTIQPGNQGHAETLRAERSAQLAERRAEYEAATGTQAETTDPAYRTWLSAQENLGKGEKYERVIGKRDRSTYDMFVEDIVQPMLMNPFQALAQRNSLGIIFWALLLGLACIAVGPPARPLIELFQAANQVILRLTYWLMLISPLAIFCLISAIIARHGPGVFESLGWYAGTVIGGIAAHVAVLLAIVAVFGRMSPWRFLSGLREAWAIAFATRSSAATLPVTVRCVTTKLGVSPKVANFTLPVGATVNMDGTALYEGVAVIFLIQIYGGMDDVGIVLGGGVTLVIFITAVLASVGAAAVPDAGLVTMVLVATAVRLPVYYLPFIFAVDAFLDMFRTSTNVMGDAVGAVVVDRYERGAPPETSDP
jgi:Na+/H+-dicarboxylate symporter